MSIKPETVIRNYVALRDRRASLKKRFEEQDDSMKADMEKMEFWLEKKMNDAGTENFKTEEGTAYKEMSVRANCADWSIFGKFCLENERIDFLERRVSNGAVKEYIEEHGTVPPGLSIERKTKVIVRRA